MLQQGLICLCLDRGADSGKLMLGKRVLIVVSPDALGLLISIFLSILFQDEVDDTRKTLQ